jgi:hypothetical protein
MTSTQLLLLPAFAHVGLIFVTAMRMGMGRVAAVRGGEVRLKDVALDNSRWPEALRKLGNNYASQFELPVLYYAVLALVLVTGLADAAQIVLSFAFVATRFVHSFIHTGANIVVRRFYAFLAGGACIALMWLWLALRLYVTG